MASSSSTLAAFDMKDPSNSNLNMLLIDASLGGAEDVAACDASSFDNLDFDVLLGSDFSFTQQPQQQQQQQYEQQQQQQQQQQQYAGGSSPLSDDSGHYSPPTIPLQHPNFSSAFNAYNNTFNFNNNNNNNNNNGINRAGECSSPCSDNGSSSDHSSPEDTRVTLGVYEPQHPTSRNSTGKVRARGGRAVPVLTEEERALLREEGVVLPEGQALTKTEERALKRVRRKIKNKLSAQDSRKKKKEYVSGLEERVEHCTRINIELNSKVLKLEQENRTMADKMMQLKQMVANLTSASSRNAVSSGVCLMTLLLSFSMFYNPAGMTSSASTMASSSSSPAALAAAAAAAASGASASSLPFQSRTLKSISEQQQTDFGSLYAMQDAVNDDDDDEQRRRRVLQSNWSTLSAEQQQQQQQQQQQETVSWLQDAADADSSSVQKQHQQQQQSSPQCSRRDSACRQRKQLGLVQPSAVAAHA